MKEKKEINLKVNFWKLILQDRESGEKEQSNFRTNNLVL